MLAKTLLFDLDGTLTDSFEGIGRSISYAVERMGRAAPSEVELHVCVGPPLRESLARLLATTDTALIERAVGFYRERYSVTGWRENHVYPGIEDVLASLGRQGHRMLVCTSKPQLYAERIVEHFGLTSHFDAVYGAALDGSLDDKVRLVAVLIGQQTLDPARCAMIGDRAQDMHAARSNDVAALGALWGYGSRGELEAAGAQSLLAAPADIPQSLLRL